MKKYALNDKDFISIKNELAEKFKEYRNEAGYTQQEVSWITGISVNTMMKLEQGKTSISFVYAFLLCRLYNKSLDNLISQNKYYPRIEGGMSK